MTAVDIAALDAADPIAHLRDEFVLDDDLIYLDGNSLGPVSHRARQRVLEVIDHEWARGLVRSWNSAGWMDSPLTLGSRVARLIGAESDEVLVADTLTFALAKLLGAALEIDPTRHVVLTDAANFHSDVYMARAIAQRAGRPVEVRLIDRNTLSDHLGSDVAVVMLTHVDFRTGEMLNLQDITAAVHDSGALMLWDFAHSTGAVPLDVEAADVDFAAGCGYKYLNAGPGSPAFLYINRRWHSRVNNPLPGWLGHARPFDFEMEYEAAAGVRAFVTSSPSILALAALDGALEVFEQDLDAKGAREESRLDGFLHRPR
jgi:kynureninase